MSQLMKNLFYLLDAQPPEAAAEAAAAAKEAVRAAEQRLTHQEFDGLWDAIRDIEHANDLDSFTLGFRLGVQLTLEGLRPVSPTDPAAPSACPCPPR